MATAWVDEPVSSLGGSVVQIQRTINKLESAYVAALGAFDASRQFRVEGHPSPAVYVAAHTHGDRRPVRRRTGLARALRTMAHTAAALAAGTITLEHAYALARTNTPRVKHLFADAEALLVRAATEMDFDPWLRGLRAWRAAADPDGADQRQHEGDDRREGHASRTFDGLVAVSAMLAEVGGTIYLDELRRLERIEFDADWAEARARLGDKATKHDLRRTAPQRRADAMVQMAIRSGRYDGDHPRPPDWVLNVVQDWASFCAETGRATDDPGPDPRFPFDPNQPADEPWEHPDPDPEGPIEHPNAPQGGQRISELEDGTPIAPSLALSLGLRGHVRGVVFGPKGNVLHHGPKIRFATGNLRHAIRLRDRWCTGNGCGVPGSECEVDHVIRATDGGPTDEWNLRLACDTHQKIYEEEVARERSPQWGLSPPPPPPPGR